MYYFGVDADDRVDESVECKFKNGRGVKSDSGEDISRVFNSVDSNSTWIHIRHSHTTEDPRSAYLDL